MILSTKKSFLFLHLYKVAGMSIRDALEPYADKRYVIAQTINHMLIHGKLGRLKNPLYNFHPRLDDVKNELGAEKFDSLYKFSFVRNPWDWQVSLYHYAMQTPRHGQSDDFKRFESFDHYIEWRVEHDLHLQSDFLCDENGELLTDYLGHFETLDADFRKVCDHLGLDCSLPHKNVSKHKSYKDYYSDNSREIVRQAFARDIESFGYEF